MPFEPLTWFLGFVFTQTSNKAIGLFKNNKLSDRIERATEEWASELPESCGVVPEALRYTLSTQSSGTEQAREQLARLLETYTIPSVEEWHAALQERWNEVRSQLPRNELQPLFKLQPEEASHHLKALAERLKIVCDREPDLFQVTVAEAIYAIKAHLDTETIRSQADLIFRLLNMEAPDYDSAITVEFVIVNLSSRPLLLSDLSVEILESKELQKVRLPRLGAPVSTIRLKVRLDPEKTKTVMSKERYYYGGHAAADFFNVRTSSKAGWTYLVRFSGQQTDLESGDRKQLHSAEFWLRFPNPH